MERLCAVLGVSKSGYYAYRNRPKSPPSKEEIEKVEKVRKEFFKQKGTFGSKRIAKELKANGTIINHKKVAKIMAESNLRAVVRRKKSTKVTKEQSAGYVYENGLNRQFDALLPNQKWVTDKTEISIDNQKFYISSLMDLYNREVIGFEVSTSPNTDLIRETIQNARKKRKLKSLENVLIHSDQGSVYRSFEYHKLMKQLKFTPSMSRKANCWDNAVIESFFSQLKTEFPHFYPNTTAGTIERNLRKYIRYNKKRIQKKLGYVSPSKFYSQFKKAV